MEPISRDRTVSEMSGPHVRLCLLPALAQTLADVIRRVEGGGSPDRSERMRPRNISAFRHAQTQPSPFPQRPGNSE